jgi:hypothetical protein
MTRDEMLRYLSLLGERLPKSVEITVGGGAALILAHGGERQTGDIDALLSAPPLDPVLRQAIVAVANEEELPEGWLNDAAKGFLDVLGEGFLERRVFLEKYGKLSVYCLSRQDLILTKLFAMRAADVEDLQFLAPTREELDYVRGELERLDRFHPKAALAISLYLDQGEGRHGG